MHRPALFRVRRSTLLALVMLAATGLAVAACAAPKPAVTFFSGSHAARTLPARYCNQNLSSCQTSSLLARLSVPAGRPLQISVPPEIAGSPWLVTFKYRLANGQEQQGRTALFPSGQQYAYTLTMPAPDDQLETVEVDQIGAAMSQDQNGYELYVRAVWVLSAA